MKNDHICQDRLGTITLRNVTRKSAVRVLTAGSKAVLALLLCKACISLAFFVLTGTFDLYLAERFQMDPASFGACLSRACLGKRSSSVLS